MNQIISRNSTLQTLQAKNFDSSMNISIDLGNLTANIELINENVLYNIDLHGEYIEKVQANDFLGYVGLFKGPLH